MQLPRLYNYNFKPCIVIFKNTQQRVIQQLVTLTQQVKFFRGVNVLGTLGEHLLQKLSLSSRASRNSFTAIVLFRLPACIHNSMYGGRQCTWHTFPYVLYFGIVPSGFQFITLPYSFKSLIQTYLDFWCRNINTDYLNTVFTQWVIQENFSKIKIYTQL